MSSRLLCCLLVMFTLAGCAPFQLPLGAATVEAAARTWVLRDSQSQAQTIDVKQVQVVGQEAVALVTYDSLQDGRTQKMTALIFVTPTTATFRLLAWHLTIGGLGWRTSGGISFARDAGQALPRLPMVFASNTEGRYDVIGGLVADPAVHRVAVLYSNGIRRLTPIINNAYMTTQSARYTVLKVEALDAQDHVLYEGTE